MSEIFVSNTNEIGSFSFMLQLVILGTLFDIICSFLCVSFPQVVQKQTLVELGN